MDVKTGSYRRGHKTITVFFECKRAIIPPSAPDKNKRLKQDNKEIYLNQQNYSFAGNTNSLEPPVEHHLPAFPIKLRMQKSIGEREKNETTEQKRKTSFGQDDRRAYTSRILRFHKPQALLSQLFSAFSFSCTPTFLRDQNKSS
ncbi:hypothetical protein AVEN_1189-1 [Araneus ventricosus]|uniref:Uncharacterized protein n=1 Tax=Araneus ventricosus TaxID=182803 RepID=A0A4Y2EE92_ARAVE|nr:hypothetical protein AVEN_1189-1 [Araneus ventricosus]